METNFASPSFKGTELSPLRAKARAGGQSPHRDSLNRPSYTDTFGL